MASLIRRSGPSIFVRTIHWSNRMQNLSFQPYDERLPAAISTGIAVGRSGVLSSESPGVADGRISFVQYVLACYVDIQRDLLRARLPDFLFASFERVRVRVRGLYGSDRNAFGFVFRGRRRGDSPKHGACCASLSSTYANRIFGAGVLVFSSMFGISCGMLYPQNPMTARRT
jgi:hypothetical protein